MGQRDDHIDLRTRFEIALSDPNRRIIDLLELSAELGEELAFLEAHWPKDLPAGLRSGLPNLPGLTGLSGKPTLPGLGGFPGFGKKK